MLIDKMYLRDFFACGGGEDWFFYDISFDRLEGSIHIDGATIFDGFSVFIGPWKHQQKVLQRVYTILVEDVDIFGRRF